MQRLKPSECAIPVTEPASEAPRGRVSLASSTLNDHRHHVRNNEHQAHRVKAAVCAPRPTTRDAQRFPDACRRAPQNAPASAGWPSTREDQRAPRIHAGRRSSSPYTSRSISYSAIGDALITRVVVLPTKRSDRPSFARSGHGNRIPLIPVIGGFQEMVVAPLIYAEAQKADALGGRPVNGCARQVRDQPRASAMPLVPHPWRFGSSPLALRGEPCSKLAAAIPAAYRLVQGPGPRTRLPCRTGMRNSLLLPSVLPATAHQTV